MLQNNFRESVLEISKLPQNLEFMKNSYLPMETKELNYNMNLIHSADYRPMLIPHMLLHDRIGIPQKSDNIPNSYLPHPGIHEKPIIDNGLNLKKTTKQTGEKSKRPRKYVHVSESMKYEQSDTYPGSKRKSSPLEKCPICKKFFRRMKTHLLKHSEAIGKPGDPLTCQFCNKMFNSGSNLSIHLRTHTGDKPYVCEICSKGFAQSCNLANHMRTHTGERPFKCPHCDRAFTQSGNLSNHIRLHTDEKPFKCHFCDRAFTQSGNLNSHIKNNHREFYENPSLFSL